MTDPKLFEKVRLCEVCSTPLKPNQSRFCGYRCTGKSKETGKWVECALKGCHNTLYVTPGQAKAKKGSYCRKEHYYLSRVALATVHVPCAVCGTILCRKKSDVRTSQKVGWHQCCRNCVPILRELRIMAREDPEAIGQSWRNEAMRFSRWCEEQGVELPISEMAGAMAFANYLAERSNRLAFKKPMMTVMVEPYCEGK